VIQGFDDPLQDAFAVRQDFVVPKAENTPATPRKEGIPSIMIAWGGVLATICFDDKPCFGTGKIRDVWANHELSSKAPAELPVSQDTP
jgi:hypothetical protein